MSKDILFILEEMITFKQPIEKIYKTLMIWSYTHNGIKPLEYEQLVEDICNTYGIEELPRLERFVKEGLLSDKPIQLEAQQQYKQIAKDFKLVDIDYKEKDKQEKVHPYMAFTPLLVKFFDLILTKEWKEPGLINQKFKKDTLAMGKPERILEKVQEFKSGSKLTQEVVQEQTQVEDERFTINKLRQLINNKMGGKGVRQDRESKELNFETDPKKKLKRSGKPSVVLYMIGGLTYAEIAGFRKVARKSGVNLVICTTEVINYKSMVNTFKFKG